MIFREIDFHMESALLPKFDGKREFRLKINHIVDSIYLRIKPLKIRTDSVIKLNCYGCSEHKGKEFWAYDGIGNVYVLFPNVEEVLTYDQRDAELAVIDTISRGLAIAAKYDSGIASNIDTILELVDSSRCELEFYRKIGRFHKSRKYKCDLIVHLKPNTYTSIVEVSDKHGNVERFDIHESKAVLYFALSSLDRLIWQGDAILGIKDDQVKFQLFPKMVRS
jgi:hypothetical protein